MSRRARWLTAGALAVVVMLLLTLNAVSAAREKRRLRAADRVAVTATLSSYDAVPGAGHLHVTLRIVNRGPALQLRAPRAEPAAYRVRSVEPLPTVPARAEGSLRLRVVPGCSHGRPATPATEPLRIVVPVVPPSGRVHDVPVAADPAKLLELVRSACDLRLEKAAEPTVSRVQVHNYDIEFDLRLHNLSPWPFTVVAVTGDGLSFGVRGGIPTVVEGHQAVVLRLVLQIPACATLPPAPDFGTLGAFELELSDHEDVTTFVLYSADPGTPLRAAVRRLANRICPVGSYRLPSPTPG